MLYDILKTVAGWLWPSFRDRRRLRLTVHRAVFGTGLECFFITATNLSRDRKLEITHVWFNVAPQVHAMPADRPLPKRLEPDEPWATWVECNRLPSDLGEEVYTLARARLSTGQVVKSKKNEGIPNMGSVPGGPIRTIRQDITHGS